MRLVPGLATLLSQRASFRASRSFQVAAVDFELSEFKAERESKFPLAVAGKALATEVAKAKASVDDDRKHILNAIAGRKADDLELPEEPPAHLAYSEINYALRGKFAAATLVPAVWADFEGIDMHVLFWSLKASPLTKLELSFEGCAKFTDDTAEQLAAHLPSRVELVVVEATATGVTEAGLTVLFNTAKAIPSIRHVRLSNGSERSWSFSSA